MKNNVLILVLVLLVSISSGSYAQKRKERKPKEDVKMSRAEKKEQKETEKEWKKKAKKLDPMAYKSLVEEHSTLKGEASSLNARMLSFEQQMSSKDTEIARLKAEVKQMEQKLADEQASNVTGMGRKMNDKGVVFKIQIGAFRKKDLTKYFDNNPNFSGDIDADGTKKYTLGYFGDYWEADNFKKYLREMGVKDAWIVPYKNGQRVNIKDVLEGAI
jgi:vacuolar-type H+-ATPase subunit I/STV1